MPQSKYAPAICVNGTVVVFTMIEALVFCAGCQRVAGAPSVAATGNWPAV